MFGKNFFLARNNGFLQRNCLFRTPPVLVYRDPCALYKVNGSFESNHKKIDPNLPAVGNQSTCGLCNKVNHKRTEDARRGFTLLAGILNDKWHPPEMMRPSRSGSSLSDRLRRIRHPEEFEQPAPKPSDNHEFKIDQPAFKVNQVFLNNAVNRYIKGNQVEFPVKLNEKNLLESGVNHSKTVDKNLLESGDRLVTNAKRKCNRSGRRTIEKSFVQQNINNYLVGRKVNSRVKDGAKLAFSGANFDRAVQEINSICPSLRSAPSSTGISSKVASTPASVLHKAFDIVSCALDDVTLKLHPELGMVREGCYTSWRCSYSLKWPEKTTFTVVAGTKKESTHKAALNVIKWLHQCGRLSRQGYPKIVNNSNMSNRQYLAAQVVPRSGPMQVRCYSTTTNRTDSMDNVTDPPPVAPDAAGPDKDMDHFHKLYPMPKNALHNAFDVLAQEMGNKALRLQPHYSVVKEKNKAQSWCCAYNLNWPEVKKIAAMGRTKQEASHKAALAALHWLQKMGRITKEGHPVIVDKKELKKLDREVMEPLELDAYTLDRMHDIVEAHQDRFMPLIVDNLDDVANNNVAAADVGDVELQGVALARGARPKFLSLGDYLAKEKVVLPISGYKQQFVDLLRDNRVVIVKGEPGCGKSTRIPQYVLEAWVTDAQAKEEICRIAVTQPRRIAAISLAERVASERTESTGDIIGYHVRLKSNFKSHTGRILYCTTGILLRHLQTDLSLSSFSHVILDEAHERDVNTDLLMNLVKRTMRVNPKLKVIVMSATIDTDLFKNYFDDAPVMHIPGFTYPVTTHFLEEFPDLNLSKTQKMCEGDTPNIVHEDVAKVIRFIHKTRPEGAILCFLPGWEDISKVQRLVPEGADLTVRCLHSRLQDSDQWKIFSRPPPGIRKVILATNIAETSVTIDDVVYVVDTGVHKENRFDNEKGVTCIDNYWIAKANMIQRKGRAGRVRPGESFHLYPKWKFDSFPEYSDPEILRTSLTKIVLDSKVYSNNMDALEFMSELPCPPEVAATKRAVAELKDLELLDDAENLTSLGKVLADFQLEPKLSKAMVNAVVYKCATPIVDIVTLFSAETELFATGLIDKDGVKRVKSQFCDTSDHLALMRIFEKWLQFYDEDDRWGMEKFCRDANLVSYKLATIEKIRKIHFEYLYKGLKDVLPISDDNSDNDELVKAVLLSGVGTLLKHRNWDIVKGRYKKTNLFLTNKNQKATLTSESVNFKKTKFPSSFLVHINETRSNIRRMTLIRETSIVSPLAVLLLSNKSLEIKEADATEGDKVILRLKDTKVEFLCPRSQAIQIVKCKEVLAAAYQYYIFQMTRGGEFNAKLNVTWDSILKNLNQILLKHSI